MKERDQYRGEREHHKRPSGHKRVLNIHGLTQPVAEASQGARALRERIHLAPLFSHAL